MRVLRVNAVVLSAAAAILSVQCGGRGTGTFAGGITPVTSPSAIAAEVQIEQYKFVPETVHVAVGGVVRWTNHDNVGHTVSFTSADTGARQIHSRAELFGPSRPANLYGSKLFQAGQSFTARFDRPGRFAYICDPHPYMKAFVIVQ